MNEKEMNMVILNKLYEIARTVFAEGTNVPDGNYTASDLAKKGDNIFKEDYLQTEIKQVPKYNMAKNYYQMVEKECYVAPMANVSVLSFVCSFCVVKVFELVAKFEKLFKEYQKAQAVTLEDQAEEVASVSNDTLDNTAEQTDDRPRWERRFDDVWANESESLQVVVKAQIKYYLSNSIYVLDDDGAIYHLQVSRYNVCEDTFTIRDAEEPDTVLYVGADRQLFAAWYHAHEITEGRYLAIKNNDPSLKEVCKEQYEDPLDGVPNELPATTEKAEPTITPGAKVIALNATETTSGAKPIMLDVGTMAKVVHISLGVPPECTEAVSGALSVASGPPNIHGVRPAVAAAGLNNAAVGYCLGVVGKVVHTLPLPPPGRNRISELTTYTNYCNTS